MHGVAAAVGAWLDGGDDPIVVRAPLAQGVARAGRQEVLGSRRTQARRREQLLARSLADLSP